MITLREYAETNGLVGGEFEGKDICRYRVEGIIQKPNGFGVTALKVRYVQEGASTFDVEPGARSMGLSLDDKLIDLSKIKMPQNAIHNLPSLVAV